MEMLESDKMKLRILEYLFNQEEAVSLNTLKKGAMAMNYRSVQRNCDFMDLMGLIKIEKKNIANVSVNLVTITSSGKKAVEKVRKIGYDDLIKSNSWKPF